MGVCCKVYFLQHLFVGSENDDDDDYDDDGDDNDDDYDKVFESDLSVWAETSWE